MNNKRLEVVSKAVLPVRVVADVGTDHGYVAIDLIENKVVSNVIATDIGEGPLSIAKQHIQEKQLASVIECRLGNGLRTLKENEVDAVVIAGMGGLLIAEIIEASPVVWRGLKFAVLQAMTQVEVLRRKIVEVGWHIDDEWLVKDDKRFYTVMRVKPGGATYSHLAYLVGPKIIEKPDPLVLEFIDMLVHKRKQILSDLSCNHVSSDLTSKRANIISELDLLEELKCQLMSIK